MTDSNEAAGDAGTADDAASAVAVESVAKDVVTGTGSGIARPATGTDDPQATAQHDELAAAMAAAGSGNGGRVSRRRNGAAVKELDVDDLLVEVRPAGPAPVPRAVPAVVAPTRSQVRAARRLQARKVGRLVRHVDLWSLLKVSLLFYVCMLLVGAVAGVLVWTALQRSGAVGSVEGFIEEIFLLENFRFEGTEMFRIGVLGGLVGVLVATLLTVLGGLLFNLISDLTGGVRVSVVELESARPVPRRSAR